MSFLVEKDSTLWEQNKSVPVLLDAFGLWDVPDEVVFKRGRDKTFLGTLCIARNITEVKAMEQELLGAQARLIGAVEELKELATKDALTARLIAEHIHESDLERFYLLGILHDIGSLVIYKKAPKAAKEALRLSEESSKYLFQVETQVHGFNHAEAGAALFHAWKLLERLIEVVACHHDPIQAKKYSREASIIHLADVISHEIDLQGTGEGFSPPIDEKILQSVGLTSRDVSAVKNQLKDQFEKTA